LQASPGIFFFGSIGTGAAAPFAIGADGFEITSASARETFGAPPRKIPTINAPEKTKAAFKERNI
jgi:hypothetical protein